ncbi:MAG TPA: hypothetical protein VHK47_03945 [Polyangia bacterium]|jgi:hypothetical protein|nr:hypothetical protein [Polyangia bacterium]
MHKVTLVRSALTLMPLAAAIGCQSTPIDPSAMADRAALSAREIVHQTGGGVAFTQSDDSGLAKIISGMAHANDGLSGMAAALPPGMMSAMSTTPMAQAAAGMPSLQTTEEQFDDTADDLKLWLRERVLADFNLESKDVDQAVYLLHPDPTCRALPRAGDPPDVVPQLSSSCVDQLTKLQVRVILSADGDGARLTMVVGPDKLELSSFVIHSNLLAIETNLPKTRVATQYVDETLGQDSPMGGDQIETLTGVVRVSLEKEGDKKVTFAISVPSAIRIATRSSDGQPGPDVQLAASDPAVSLSADGVAQTATARVNLGALDVLTNWDPPGSSVTKNRDLHVAIGALTGSTTFTEGMDQLTAKGLGIGATSVVVRNQATIFDLGLNPSDNHRFDLVVSLDGAGQPRFAVTPRFDLSMGFHFGAVANDFPRESPPASYLLDETYRILLDAGGSAATVTAAPATTTFGGGLAVGPGTLTLSSSKVATPLVVPAGKCLTSAANPPADAHPILGAFAVTDCPVP